MKAYLEDFTIVKVIIDNKKYQTNQKFYINKTKELKVIEENCIGNEVHLILQSDEKLVPHLDYTLSTIDIETNVLLGKITRSNLFDKTYYFDGWLGYRYSKEKTIFRVWSPVVKEIYVVIDDVKYPLQYMESGVWTTTINQDLESKAYYYRCRINSEFFETLDPYGNSSNANNKCNYIIDIDKTYQMKYGYVESKNPIIYELSVRDATSFLNKTDSGTFDALTKSALKDYGLGYIKNLGITHIQLMPIFAFDGVDENIKDSNNSLFKYNWGYNPTQYFVPSGFLSKNAEDPYERINELKKLIDKIHQLGMGVNMDVVYNHVYDNLCFPFEKLVPGYTFRTDKQEFLTNASWCGNDLKTDHLMIRKLIIDSLQYFQKIYRIDGFRFDLMGLIDIDTIKEAYKKITMANPFAMMYGEGWNMPVEMPNNIRANMNNCQKLEHIAFFNDGFREFFKSLLNNNLKSKQEIFHYMKGYYYNGGEFLDASQSINYLECHDNRTLYDFLKLNNEENHILDKISLGLAITILTMGTPFIHAGEELLRTKHGFDNSYNLSDDINHIDWYKIPNLTNTLKNLIVIKNKYPHFSYLKKEDINKYLRLEQTSEITSIRYLAKGFPDLQVVISQDYNEYTKYFAPGTKLIFDGNNIVDVTVEKYDFIKPGLYIFKK